MVRIPFQRLENAFECLESHSNSSKFGFEWLEFLFQSWNMHLNASNLERVRICIQMVRILFQC